MLTFFKGPVEKLIFFLLAESFLVLLAVRVINFYHFQLSVSDILITIFAVCNFIIGIFIIGWLLKVDYSKKEDSLQKRNLESAEEALKLMRGERHEFVNHLNSIYGLINSGEHKEAAKYIEDMGNECRFNSRVLDIPNVSLRSLLQNKKDAALAVNADFDLQVQSKLEYFHMKPADITKVFGNILDNAVDAVVNLGKEYPKLIVFSITESETSYIFSIGNSGPAISDDIAENMFEEGFSTRGAYRGYGLALVKKTAAAYGGNVFYQREENSFFVVIPKSGELVENTAGEEG
ncbi:MAG: GHKL domain-containing protein [Clostridiales bacterium]|nr:GHKL domain-containing protein [Clostridiales bacterium]MCF8021215.1 GHKL domain-containing protein [Clostridiales bacterium]